MGSLFKRVSNTVFALLFAVFSINLTGVMGVANAGATSGADAPTFVDECETANDEVVIPTAPSGYSYWYDLGDIDFPMAPGTYSHSDLSENYWTQPLDNLTIKLKKWAIFTTATWSHNYTNLPCVTPVATEAPYVETDECGVESDTFFVPTVEGVVYKVDGTVVSGSVSTEGAESVLVTAEAADGYELTGATQWTLEFGTAVCVTPEKPKFTDPCEIEGDSYTIPSQDGVVYKVNGVVTAPGTYYTDADDYGVNGKYKLTITAESADGYVINDGSKVSWTKTLKNKICATPEAPVFTDVCGTENDTYTLPDQDGVRYKVRIDGGSWSGWMTAGTYNYTGVTGHVQVKAGAYNGHQLEAGVDKNWTSDEYTNVECLPASGEVKGDDPDNDPCDINADTFEMFAAVGVGYRVSVNGGTAVDALPGVQKVTDWAGDYSGSSVDIEVTAYALPGYVYNGSQDTWNYTFTDEVCTPGQGSVTPPSPIVPVSTGVQLPQTGSNGANPLVAILVTALAGIAAYAVALFAQNRRDIATSKK